MAWSQAVAVGVVRDGQILDVLKMEPTAYVTEYR